MDEGVIGAAGLDDGITTEEAVVPVHGHRRRISVTGIQIAEEQVQTVDAEMEGEDAPEQYDNLDFIDDDDDEDIDVPNEVVVKE